MLLALAISPRTSPVSDFLTNTKAIRSWRDSLTTLERISSSDWCEEDIYSFFSEGPDADSLSSLSSLRSLELLCLPLDPCQSHDQSGFCRKTV
ncbi:hypothetical protein DY000_02001612, partial [Brassica cretica]